MKLNIVLSLGAALTVLTVGQHTQAAVTSAVYMIRFELYNASTGALLRTLENGDVIDTAADGSSLTIRARVGGSGYQSVKFEHLKPDGTHRVFVDNDSAYTLGGSNDGSLVAVPLSTGGHSLKGTVYTRDDAQGNSSAPKMISFTVKTPAPLGIRYPGATWPAVDTSGFDSTKLAAARNYLAAQKPLGAMVLHNGKVVISMGAISTKRNVHSVSKSLRSVLYGTAVASGRMDLSSTMADLGIDDKTPSLTAREKTATLRNLLQFRSGIYHDAAYETDSMEAARPARGSHDPGTFWYYNNWDNNASGAIYTKVTGESIAFGFYNRLARPVGMQDFLESDVRLAYESVSLYPANVFTMSARDMARFGLLVLANGNWNGQQVVPASWIKESTTAYTPIPEADGLGYGYLWWVLKTSVTSSSVGTQTIGPGAVTAAGVGGQRITIIPHHGLVIAWTVDNAANPDGIKRSEGPEFIARLIAAKK